MDDPKAVENSNVAETNTKIEPVSEQQAEADKQEVRNLLEKINLIISLGNQNKFDQEQGLIDSIYIPDNLPEPIKQFIRNKIAIEELKEIQEKEKEEEELENILRGMRDHDNNFHNDLLDPERILGEIFKVIDETNSKEADGHDAEEADYNKLIEDAINKRAGYSKDQSRSKNHILENKHQKLAKSMIAIDLQKNFVIAEEYLKNKDHSRKAEIDKFITVAKAVTTPLINENPSEKQKFDLQVAAIRNEMQAVKQQTDEHQKSVGINNYIKGIASKISSALNASLSILLPDNWVKQAAEKQRPAAGKNVSHTEGKKRATEEVKVHLPPEPRVMAPAPKRIKAPALDMVKKNHKELISELSKTLKTAKVSASSGHVEPSTIKDARTKEQIEKANKVPSANFYALNNNNNN